MRIFLFTLVAFIGTLPSPAQTDSIRDPFTTSLVVDTIIVSGNEKTKAYVILDEMTIKPGMEATAELIEFDKNRIYSLGLFTRVEILGDTLEGKRFLLVDVSERWFLIPLLFGGFRDGDPKKPYLGVGLLYNNLFGRNQKVAGTLVFGYNPSLGFSFTDPLISRAHRLFFSGNVSYSRIRNKSKVESALTGDFDEDHYNINATVGHRYNLFETTAFTAGFTMVSIDEYRPNRTASPNGKDAFIFASVGYTRDSRDLREYPSKGSFVSLYLTKSGFGEAELSFTRLGTDLRKYLPLPLDFTLAGRLHASFVSGTFVPAHSRVYFGYGERIRGYFKDVFEGEDLVGTTVELHWPLLKPRTINFTAISIPQEFSVWRFGISLAVFADAGVAWFRKQPVTLGSFASGYGTGVHFLLPYSAIMRVEYAWNEYGRGQFILDFRTSI
ncbi:MAG: BamA/TamA family outer membrane protein [Bacteroidota bacterium]